MDLAEAPTSSSDEGDPGSGNTSGSWLQILANYATLLVAVSAVTLSVWQGYEMRKHNRLSVLPNVDVVVKQLSLEKGEEVELGGTSETVTERTSYLGIKIENTGLGPAVFEKAKLFRAGADTVLYQTSEKGEVLNIYRADSFAEQTRRLFPEMSRFSGSIRQGVMMKAGETQPFLQAGIPASSIPDTLDGNPRRRLRALISRYSFVGCYCSVYGENCDHVSVGAKPPSDPCGF